MCRKSELDKSVLTALDVELLVFETSVCAFVRCWS